MIYSPSELRAAREKLGWSQHDLAIKSDVHAVMIGRYENGGNARSDILQKLTDALQKGGASDIFSFNLNDEITVTPTAHGTELLNKRFLELQAKFPEEFPGDPPAKVGVPYRDQMWSIFRRIGPSLYNGGKNAVVGNIIQLDALQRAGGAE